MARGGQGGSPIASSRRKSAATRDMLRQREDAARGYGYAADYSRLECIHCDHSTPLPPRTPLGFDHPLHDVLSDMHVSQSRGAHALMKEHAALHRRAT